MIFSICTSKVACRVIALLTPGPFGCDEHYHANMQNVRNAYRARLYMKKEGDWIGSETMLGPHASIMTAPTRDAAWALAREHLPKECLLDSDRLEKGITRWIPLVTEFVSPYNPDSFRPTTHMRRWVDQELPLTQRAKCLVLIGATRVGKSAWARSLGRHMFFRGSFNLSKWDPAAKYLIFDDIPWKFIPAKKQLLTQMGECEVTDKYRPKATVNVTMPAIVCLNEEDIAGEDDPRHQPYWIENCIFSVITLPLFAFQPAVASP